ncbi:MAG TPA: hypothetical protein VG917_02495, partial [Patescibacteria group bacterium]|nr:hypothetical protein [Patescibacteria group bacterium]
LDLLKSINKKGTTIFMATHNDRIIEKTTDRVIAIEHGKLAHDRKAIKKDHSNEEKVEKKEAKEEDGSRKHSKEDDKKMDEKIKLEALASKEVKEEKGK